VAFFLVRRRPVGRQLGWLPAGVPAAGASAGAVQSDPRPDRL